MSKRYSNLLAKRFRHYLILRRRLIQWSVIWSVCLAASLGWWYFTAHSVTDIAERVALMEARSSPLHEMQKDNQRILQQLNELHKHQALLTQLNDEQVPFRMLALVSTQVGERGESVRIESFEMLRAAELADQPAAVAGSAASPVANEVPPIELCLRGLATDNLAVSLFVAGLRDSGVFHSVDLKSSVGARADTQLTQAFIIECAL